MRGVIAKAFGQVLAAMGIFEQQCGTWSDLASCKLQVIYKKDAHVFSHRAFSSPHQVGNCIKRERNRVMLAFQSQDDSNSTASSK